MLTKVRVDKWLWSVRIFKSRTLSSDACKSGKVKIGGTNIKSSYLVQVGETLEVKKEGFNMIYKVVELIDKRVGAPIAQKCYEDQTPPEEMNKFKDWYIDNQAVGARERGAGRPTKRERRAIDKFKDVDE
jgi:ribosome-associated heat shock protein Hsp15